MYLYHTTNKYKIIEKEGLRNVRKILNFENTNRRKRLDKGTDEYKTVEAIYLFREEELGKNLAQHFNNTILEIKTNELDIECLRVFNYSLYHKMKYCKTDSEEEKRYIKEYWESSLSFEEYRKKEEAGEIDYIPEFLYFKEKIETKYFIEFKIKTYEKKKLIKYFLVNEIPRIEKMLNNKELNKDEKSDYKSILKVLKKRLKKIEAEGEC